MIGLSCEASQIPSGQGCSVLCIQYLQVAVHVNFFKQFWSTASVNYLIDLTKELLPACALFRVVSGKNHSEYDWCVVEYEIEN